MLMFFYLCHSSLDRLDLDHERLEHPEPVG